MAFNFPEGSKFQYSVTFAGAVTVSAATNANPSVLTTSASHGLSTDDEFLFTSGWEDATNGIYRSNTLSTTTLGAKGLDTTSTVFYPAGSGVGTTQKITNWVDIPQVLDISADGGGARYTEVALLSARNAIKIPTGFDPASTTLTLAHDITNANYVAMLNLSRTLSKVAFRITNGTSATYAYGYMNVNEQAKMQRGNVNTVECAISFLGRPISY